VDTHGFYLRSQIQEQEGSPVPAEHAAAVTDALARGDLDAGPLPENLRALLSVAGTITRHAYQVTDAQIQDLRDKGWTEPQIAEMVYVTALFAFFNRVADAFGIDSQGYGGPRPEWE
jgi:alkylhydroperoxidase family enzyme